MFFYKNIKSNPTYNKTVIFLINGILTLLKIIKPTNKKNTNNIVIVALHKLGDSIFTIPAIKNILHHHQKDIFLICFAETIPIYKIVFESINFIEFNPDDFAFNNRIAKRKARKVLKKLNPLTVYDLTGTITSASLLFNSSAKEIIGINEPYYRPLYTKYYSIRTKPHIAEIYLDAIRQVIPIYFSGLDEIKNNDLGEYILIHPFAGTESKEWGLKKFVGLAGSLDIRFDCLIVSPANKIPSDVIKEMEKKNIKFKETKTVDELIEIIKGCLLLIGNDSGPVHIANLLGKPTFTIYGPTNPDFHKPLKGINNYIYMEIPCSPKLNEKMCFTHGGMIGCPSFECMNNLTLDEVKKSVNEFISYVEKQNIGMTA